MVAEQAWLASESHTPDRPESDPTGDDRSPVTPASTLFSSPDSPTTVLLRAAGNFVPGAQISDQMHSILPGEAVNDVINRSGCPSSCYSIDDA